LATFQGETRSKPKRKISVQLRPERMGGEGQKEEGCLRQNLENKGVADEL